MPSSSLGQQAQKSSYQPILLLCGSNPAPFPSSQGTGGSKLAASPSSGRRPRLRSPASSPQLADSPSFPRSTEDEEAPAEHCEIARLPEDLLSAALSRMTPRDACRAAAVSRAFCAAADSDAVWACFLPPAGDLPPLADGEPVPRTTAVSRAFRACFLPHSRDVPPPHRKKDLFLRLSGSPVLLPGGLVSMWLDRETGTKCYMLSARELSIARGDTPDYWTWIPLADDSCSRFSEGAQLRRVCWLDIRGKIQTKMLSPHSAYTAYMVYKLAAGCRGLDSPAQEASVSVGGINLSTRRVRLQGPVREREQTHCVRMIHHQYKVHHVPLLLPERADGWMEIELGDLFCEGDEDGDVTFGLAETKQLNWKSGLIMQGIEIRRKV